MHGPRYERRKKKRINQMLNTAIAIVCFLIIVFAIQLFIGEPSEQALQNEEDIDVTPEENVIPDPIEKTDDDQAGSEEDVREDDRELVIGEEEDDVEEDDGIVDGYHLEPVPDGEWKPIGTRQTGAFSHNFDRSSLNWEEMTLALRYATNLGEDMIIWRLENGGSPTRARGVVSSRDEQDTPYEVYIEWIDGEGWMPVEKNKLQHNPYK